MAFPSALCLAALAAAAGPKIDTRFNGAYRFSDGRVAVVGARAPDVLGLRFTDGEGRRLHRGSRPGHFEAGPPLREKSPVELDVRFGPGGAIELRPRGGGDAVKGRKLPLAERVGTFTRGKLRFRAKIVYPEGKGPFPLVVLAHGSEADSAVDTDSDPYLFAAHGFATAAFDKRGTGESQGVYTQNFRVLSDDLVEAVGWARKQPRVDGKRLHLVGFSQGGWVAPLAATKLKDVASLLIGYGPMVTVKEEDRWSYVEVLRRSGFGDDALAEADRINETLSRIIDQRADAWAELERQVAEAKGKPWWKVARTTETSLGLVAQASDRPVSELRAMVDQRLAPVDGAPFIDRLYDPVPTLASLDVPSLWILGGSDDSMPTAWTVRELEKLKAKGKPISIALYPEADHGILRFEVRADGTRRHTGYEPTYVAKMVGWLRERSGAR